MRGNGGCIWLVGPLLVSLKLSGGRQDVEESFNTPRIAEITWWAAKEAFDPC